ncbi:MAG TPA: hypothetical protein V6D00_03215 [Pantanalinema sp.]
MAALLAIGCAVHPPATPFVGTSAVTVSQARLDQPGAETSLRVVIDGGRGPQAVPATWTKADLTLANTSSSILPSALTKSVNQAGGSTLSAVFTGLRPAAGYSLTVKLYNGATLAAQGTNASFSLSGGANSVSVTLSLSGGGGTPGTIVTIAGLLTPPSGRSATNWGISPRSMVFDASGNLYIADATSHVVLKRDASGTLTLIAGTGMSGFSGDGAAATSAMLNQPSGVAVDGAGNVYISDTGNNRIRRVNTSGTISTVAGTGTGSYSGDGGAATSATLKGPSGIAVDASGNLLIADMGNCRVRFVPKVAGSYFGKTSLVVGNIYLVAGDGTSDSQMGGLDTGLNGQATSFMLGSPAAVAFGASSNFYVLSNFNSMLYQVSSTGVISKVAGAYPYGYTGDGGVATNARMRSPYGFCVSGSDIYIADSSNNCIRKVSGGTITRVAGTAPGTMNGGGNEGYSGEGGAPLSAQLRTPLAVAVDPSGKLYIADTGNNRVRLIDGGVITTIAGTGGTRYSGDGVAATTAQLGDPRGMVLDAQGRLIFADSANSVVRCIDTDGTVTTIAGSGTYGDSGDGGAATAARLKTPTAVAVDSAGAVYVVDQSANRIRKFTPGGTIATFAGTGVSGTATDGTVATSMKLSSPAGVAVDSSDNVFFSEYDTGYVWMVPKTTGNYFGRSNLTAGKAYILADGSTVWPDALVTDSAGNLYMANWDSVWVLPRVSGSLFGASRTAGTLSSVRTGFGGLGSLALDASGNLYLADAGAHKVQKLAGTTLTLLAGTGTAGFSGDEGPATSAKLNAPTGIAVDGSGNVYVADTTNQRIRKIIP